MDKMEKILSDVREKFNFDTVALTDVECSRCHSIKWKYNIGSTNDRWRKIELRSGKGLPGIVMKTGKSLVVDAIERIEMDGGVFQYPMIKIERLESFIAMPLWNDTEEVIGIVLLGNRQSRHFLQKEYEEIKEYVERHLRQQILKELIANEGS
ncbi:GAF domain-containing protein [Salinicoccus sp. CNSTN-B1]